MQRFSLHIYLLKFLDLISDCKFQNPIAKLNYICQIWIWAGF